MCPTLCPHQLSLTQDEKGNISHVGKLTVPPETLGDRGQPRKPPTVDWSSRHTHLGTHPLHMSLEHLPAEQWVQPPAAQVSNWATAPTGHRAGVLFFKSHVRFTSFSIIQTYLLYN